MEYDLFGNKHFYSDKLNFPEHFKIRIYEIK